VATQHGESEVGAQRAKGQLQVAERTGKSGAEPVRQGRSRRRRSWCRWSPRRPPTQPTAEPLQAGPAEPDQRGTPGHQHAAPGAGAAAAAPLNPTSRVAAPGQVELPPAGDPGTEARTKTGAGHCPRSSCASPGPLKVLKPRAGQQRMARAGAPTDASNLRSGSPPPATSVASWKANSASTTRMCTVGRRTAPRPGLAREPVDRRAGKAARPSRCAHARDEVAAILCR